VVCTLRADDVSALHFQNEQLSIWKPLGELTINNRITTALLLAAGTGSRLRPLTLDAPKCLTEVSGQTILGRLIDNLRIQGIERLVVVTGYLDHCIREFLEENAADMQLDYVFNPVFQTTNNIYSLWLAHKAIEEPFVLIESDLVFEASMLEPMLTPDRIAVSNLLPWMNGTVVEINTDKTVKAFHVNHDVDDERRYKTVNICSFSSQNWQRVYAQLDQYIESGRVNEYYEAVFADMVSDASLEFDAVFFDENKWYEIDAAKDLHQAELMFPRIPAINFPEYPKHRRLAQRALAKGCDIVKPVTKTLISDNSVSIKKSEPGKIQ